MHPGKYKLTGYAKDFYQEVKLHYNVKKLSFLIQTDKPVYKASDEVNFRVIAIDADTRPYYFEHSDPEVFAIDANHNKIKKWTNASFENGIFEGSFSISSLPLLGSWFLLVEGDDEVTKLKLRIVEYVYPVFLKLLDRIKVI